MTKVIIFQAIPGAGKTTYIRENYANAIVFSADSYFMRICDCSIDVKNPLSWCEKCNGKGLIYKFDSSKIGDAHASCLRGFVQEVIEYAEWEAENGAISNSVIIIDNTNVSQAEYAPYAAIATAYKMDVSVITLLCDPELAWKRNVHGVTLKDVMSMDHRIRGGIPHVPKYWNHEVISLC